MSTSRTNLSLTLVALFLIICGSLAQKKSKYSKESNIKTGKHSKEEISAKLVAKNPFRMQKFNLFWEQVKEANHLNADQRTQLFADLLAHDEGEINLKHLKVSD